MNSQARRTESILGAIILLVLLLVLAWVVQRQARFDPSVLIVTAVREVRPEGPGTVTSGESPFEPWIPQGLSPLGPPERFDAETLSEKIDGKAELYLSSGFVGLQCQRFKGGAGGNAWVEVFLYDMGEPRNAFSVFSAQRRAEAEDVNVTRFAYRTSNALFLAHGKDYLEVIGSNEALGELIVTLAKGFVGSRPADDTVLDELTLFPREGLEAGSITLLSDNVFGHDRLDRTYIGHYRAGSARLTAFISRRVSESEAEELGSAYVRFLIDNGGSELDSHIGIPSVKVVQLFDTFDVVFIKGRLLAGVHEAEDRAAAEALAVRLYEALPQ